MQKVPVRVYLYMSITVSCYTCVSVLREHTHEKAQAHVHTVAVDLKLRGPCQAVSRQDYVCSIMSQVQVCVCVCVCLSVCVSVCLSVCLAGEDQALKASA